MHAPIDTFGGVAKSARVHLLNSHEADAKPPEFAVKKQGQNFSASLSYRQYSSLSCSHSFSNAGTEILKPAMIGATRKGCAFIEDDEWKKDSRMKGNSISAFFFIEVQMEELVRRVLV